MVKTKALSEDTRSTKSSKGVRPSLKTLIVPNQLSAVSSSSFNSVELSRTSLDGGPREKWTADV